MLALEYKFPYTLHFARLGRTIKGEVKVGEILFEGDTEVVPFEMHVCFVA